MFFRTWVGTTGPYFRPQSADSKPSDFRPVLDASIDGEPMTRETASAVAQGFNEAELESPVGSWAVVLPADQTVEKYNSYPLETCAALN